MEVSLSPLETEEGTLVSAAVRDVTERIRARRCVAPSDGRFHAHQQGDHHGGADCLSGARNQAADCSDGNERSNLLALASARSTQRSKNIRNCVKGRERRNARDIISRVQLQFQKGPSKRESVDVNEVIREMIALLESEATRYNILVRTELAADLPHVMGDRVQLQQVLMNLMINSIDATKSVDGTRELAIKSQRTDNEQLQVSVSDTGIGLPPQQADQIFNAFFTTKPHGTGMGLRISRSIIESHGGRLWASANDGRGATFYFTLPTQTTHTTSVTAA